MILRITYLSGPYRVKAYLGLPRGSGAAPEAVQAAIESFHGAPGGQLPVELVASSRQALAGGGTAASPLEPASSMSLAPAGEAASPLEPARSLSPALPSSAPPTAPSGPPRLPALVLCRGGLGKVGAVRPHWVDAFAARGFVVFAPCYRGNEGGEGRDEFGGADREDVAAALRLVRALPWADPGPAAIAGFSRGAINAARAAVDMPDAVRRLVLWSGVADLARTYEERVDLRRMLKRLLGGTPARQPEAYQERSPLHLADRLRCPALIAHGGRDELVDAGHGLSMHERLTALGIPVELVYREEFGHHFPYGAHEALLDRMAAWLKES